MCEFIGSYEKSKLKTKMDKLAEEEQASQDSNPYIIVAFTDPNESKSAGGGGGGSPQNPFGIGIGAVPLTSPEDLMKNLPKTMSNIFGERGMSGDSPTFKITMKEYENMAIKVGDRVEIEIVKADDSSGI